MQADSQETDRWLLVSDVDQTLVGDDAAWAEFAEAVRATPSLLLALNSSRPRSSVQSTLADLSPPMCPHALITAMGTEVLLHGRPLTEWDQRFAGWRREPIDRIMRQCGATQHEPEMQTPLKASFALSDPQACMEAARAIEACGVEARIIQSGASDFDVIPARAGKEAATLFLARTLGVPLDRLIIAGDSGNDLAMFQAARHGIVVANARDELRHAVDPDRTCFASRSHARGVLEGLAYFGVPIQAVSHEGTISHEL